MSNSFEAGDGRLMLELYGKSFEAELNESTALWCRETLEQAKKRLEAMKDGSAGSKSDDCETCTFLRQSINGLLGENAVEELFGAREMSLEGISELMCQVVSQLREGFEAENKKLCEN